MIILPKACIRIVDQIIHVYIYMYVHNKYKENERERN
jgi:hypothetical protein